MLRPKSFQWLSVFCQQCNKMNIRLIWVGKNKDSYLKNALDEYLKRIKPFAEIAISEVPDVALSGSNNPEIVIRKEGELISQLLDKVVKQQTKPVLMLALDARGVMLDSVELAGFLEEKMPYHELIFVIGGVYGLASGIKEKADLVLSLSRMTFTHQMVRIILLEQIYRGLTIIRGKKYHY